MADGKILDDTAIAQTWVEEHGDALFRYALSRLRNHSSAEDVVQETFLVAFDTRDRFTGKSSIRTWLVGILKHKIIDLIRKEGREMPMQEWIDDQNPAEERFFDPHGRWKVGPSDWKVNPSSILQRQEFFSILHTCLGNLPKKQRDVFVLRELENQVSEEICKLCSVSSTNLWVLLHRARIGLRQCLEFNWFAKGAEENKTC